VEQRHQDPGAGSFFVLCRLLIHFLWCGRNHKCEEGLGVLYIERSKVMPQKTVVVSVPVDDVVNAVKFYSTLLGIEFARSLSQEQSFHAPISNDGLQLTVNQRHYPGEPVTFYIAVDDLAAAINTAQQQGGKVAVQPFDLPVHAQGRAVIRANFPGVNIDSLGRAAEIEDPSGNRIGLIQFTAWSRSEFQVDVPLSAPVLAKHNTAITHGKNFAP